MDHLANGDGAYHLGANIRTSSVSLGSVVVRHTLSYREIEKAQKRQSEAEEKEFENCSLHSLRMLIVHLPIPGILTFVPVHYILVL